MRVRQAPRRVNQKYAAQGAYLAEQVAAPIYVEAGQQPLAGAIPQPIWATRLPSSSPEWCGRHTAACPNVCAKPWWANTVWSSPRAQRSSTIAAGSPSCALDVQPRRWGQGQGPAKVVRAMRASLVTPVPGPQHAATSSRAPTGLAVRGLL